MALREHGGAVDGNILRITGIIDNICGHPFRYVEVKFRLYDKSNFVIGTAWTNQAGLDTGDAWKFSASTFIKNARGVNYKLESIEGR